MELLSQWLMAILFSLSPLVGYWLYTLAPDEVEFGKKWLFAAVLVALIAMVYVVVSSSQSIMVVLSAVIALGLFSIVLLNQQFRILVFKKFAASHPLLQIRLFGFSVWFFMILMATEGMIQGLVELSSTVIIAGLMMGSLIRDRRSAMLLGITPLVVLTLKSIPLLL